jgi:ribosome-associated protein
VLRVSRQVTIPDDEIVFSAIRAQGAGGQHVNKASTAVQLRFDIPASSLPDELKERLLALRDSRISKDGVVVIKAQSHRSQEKNRAEALERLSELVRRAAVRVRKRVPTKPTRSSQRKRLEVKTHRGNIKKLRRSPED